MHGKDLLEWLQEAAAVHGRYVSSALNSRYRNEYEDQDLLMGGAGDGTEGSSILRAVAVSIRRLFRLPGSA